MSKFFSLSASGNNIIDDDNSSTITTYSSYEIDKLLKDLTGNITNCSVKEYPPDIRTNYQDTFETPNSTNSTLFWVLREGVKMAPGVDYIIVDSHHIKFVEPIPPSYSVSILIIGNGVNTSNSSSGSNSGGNKFIFTQSMEYHTWSIPHNLGFKYPQIILVDGNDNLILADIHYDDNNNCTINFDTPCSGKCICSI